MATAQPHGFRNETDIKGVIHLAKEYQREELTMSLQQKKTFMLSYLVLEETSTKTSKRRNNMKGVIKGRKEALGGVHRERL